MTSDQSYDPLLKKDKKLAGREGWKGERIEGRKGEKEAPFSDDIRHIPMKKCCCLFL